MIEVEKKFQPTEEELRVLLSDSEFVKEVQYYDVFYDYPDYSLWKNGVYLRKRNDNFELKVEVQATGAHEEIEDEEGIKKHFRTEKPVIEFIKENLLTVVDFTTKRRKYKKGEFNIDVDELSFGYRCVEVELLVEDASQIEKAKGKIDELAKEYGFTNKKAPSKRKEYFRIIKPEIFKEIYGDK